MQNYEQLWSCQKEIDHPNLPDKNDYNLLSVSALMLLRVNMAQKWQNIYDFCDSVDTYPYIYIYIYIFSLTVFELFCLCVCVCVYVFDKKKVLNTTKKSRIVK